MEEGGPFAHALCVEFLAGVEGGEELGAAVLLVDEFAFSVGKGGSHVCLCWR